MQLVRRIRKTRPQRKALKVGIISSILAVSFGVGFLFSAINYPRVDELDNLYEGNILNAVQKLDNNDYYITCTHKNSENILDDTILYFYNSDDALISKTSVFKDAKDKFGITDLNAFSGCHIIEETNSMYVASNNYLFHYSGINERNLVLEGYSSSFPGRICQVDGNQNDLYVLSQVGTQYRLDRFKSNDETYTAESSGYIYEVTSKSNSYVLNCSKNLIIYSFDVAGDYLYLNTGTYIRRIHRDMIDSNYRILYEEELEEVKAAEPELSNDEAQEKAKDNCLTKYGWLDYNYGVHTVTLSNSDISPNNFSFYLLPEMIGVTKYHEKFYFLDKSNVFYSYNISDLENTSRVINYLDGELTPIKDVKLPVGGQQEVSINALNYETYGTTGTIFHVSSSPMVTIIDFENEQLLYSIELSTRVSRVVYNESTGTIIYQYQDPVNRESGVNYLSKCDARKMTTVSYIKPLLTAFIILTSVALLVAIVSWLCYLIKNVMSFVSKTAKGMKKHWIIYVILLPSVFLLTLFCYYPGIAAIFTSFFDYKAGISDIKTWNNFGNYVTIFANPDSLLHFGNMALFLLADVALAIIPPLIFAFFLTLMKSKKMSGILRTLLFIPGIIPGIASLLIWKIGIYGDYGVINTIIKASGGEPIMFFMTNDYMNIIWLILMGFPFVGSYLIFYGAMMNIPSSYYEAAELDGITIWKRFFKIDLPLCFPQIKYILIMTIIGSIQNFSRVYIAMGRTQNVLITPIVEMYMLMNGAERDYGLASAYATILFVILFGLTYLSMRNRIKQK